VYVSAGLKGRERDSWLRSRGLATHGRGTYDGDKPPIFTIVDRSTGQRYVIPAKFADESTVRRLLANRQQESLTVYTDGFRAYEPLDDDDEFSCEFVVHDDGEYADDEVNVNTSARATGRCCGRGSRPIAGSQRTGSHSISERSKFRR